MNSKYTVVIVSIATESSISKKNAPFASVTILNCVSSSKLLQLVAAHSRMAVIGQKLFGNPAAVVSTTPAMGKDSQVVTPGV